MGTSVKYRAQNFKPGDLVTLYTGGNSSSPYVGIVTHIFPKIDRLNVEWPTGNTQEDPRFLHKTYSGLHVPAVSENTSYNSHQNSNSEKWYGKISSKIATNYTKNIIAANDLITFLTKKGHTQLKTYDAVYDKFNSSLPDGVIRSLVLITSKLK